MTWPLWLVRWRLHRWTATVARCRRRLTVAIETGDKPDERATEKVLTVALGKQQTWRNRLP